jgi:hypothetical protein
MKRILFILFAIPALAISLWPVSAQQQRPQSSTPANIPKPHVGPVSPEEMVKQFTAKESELREVWKSYQYVQESKLQVLGPANVVSGEYYQVSEFVFNDAGKRLERILKAPPSTLDRAGLTMTQEDKDSFINLQPFALAKEDLSNYMVSYVGPEKVDELNTYVFDVIPKVMANQRELDRMRKQGLEGKYFQGKIWVDTEDMQIVKTAGKTVPEFKQRFPKFETYRENIDGRYWFPTYTYGDDTLYFDKGGAVHVRMVVKYKNYRQFSSDVRLLDTEEIKDEKTKPPATENKDAKPGDVKKDDPKADKTKPIRPRP